MRLQKYTFIETTSEPEPASDIARAPMCSPKIISNYHNNITITLAACSTWAQFGQVLLLLGFCSIPRKEIGQYWSIEAIFFKNWPVDLVYTKVAVGPIAESNGSTCPADFLHGNDMIQVAHPWAPKVRVGSDPQKTHVAQFSPEVLAIREVVCFVNCICMRCQLLRTKVKIESNDQDSIAAAF